MATEAARYLMERRNENIHGVFKHVGEKIMKIINLC
jgi:23S rRNA maturation-related 3'-5' exoribonuclease YhaM